MTPEPLTKEKVKTIRVIEWLEGDPYRRKRHNFNSRTDLSIVLPEAVFIEDLQERIEQLLKEIEKEYNATKNGVFEGSKARKAYHIGFLHGLEIAKHLIKKAFSGVVRE